MGIGEHKIPFEGGVPVQRVYNTTYWIRYVDTYAQRSIKFEQTQFSFAGFETHSSNPCQIMIPGKCFFSSSVF